jgi:peroxiredoxin
MPKHPSPSPRRSYGTARAFAFLLLVAFALILGGCGTTDSIVPATPIAAPRPQTAVPTSANTPASKPTATVRPTGPVEGAVAPDFTVTDLDGQTFKLSDLRGKRVLLNFWATWCPPCRAELPQLQAAHIKYGKDDFVVLGVDYGESKTQVSDFARNNNLTFRFAMDTSGEALLAYDIHGIPTSFFIDRQGIIVSKQPGAITTAIIDKTLLKMP